MAPKNPKLIIIDYYDSLIRQVDIYTEEQLEKYSDESVIDDVTENNESDVREMILDHYRDVDFRYISDSDEENSDGLVFMPQNTPKQTILESAFDDPYLKQSKFKYPKEKAKYEPPPSTANVHQFLNQMRDELIAEIKKGQEAALNYFETIKADLKVDQLESDEEIDQNLMAKLFETQFMFLILDTDDCEIKIRNSPFKLYLIVLDFYLNEQERELFK